MRQKCGLNVAKIAIFIMMLWIIDVETGIRGNLQIEFPYDRQRDLFIAFNCHREISHRLYKCPTLVFNSFKIECLVCLSLHNYLIVWSAYFVFGSD